MEIRFTISLNFWHLCSFAFASLPEHCTTVVILSQHLSYLSGNIISWKIMSFKIKMKGNFLLKSLSVDAFFTLERLCFSSSPWYPPKVRCHKCLVKSDDFHYSVPARHLGGIFGGHIFEGLKFHTGFQTVSCSSFMFAVQESYRMFRPY